MKINSCFMNEQPNFFKEVYDEKDNHIATIRTLTPEDEDIIRRKARFCYDLNNNINYDLGAYENYHILLALGGSIGDKSYKKGDEGIKICNENGKKPVITDENVGLLIPKFRMLILNAILKQKNEWSKNQKAIEKN